MIFLGRIKLMEYADLRDDRTPENVSAA